MPKVGQRLTYKEHKQRWKDCTQCELCDVRNRIVLARGKIPCHLLFIGEAPGASEDVLGKPFIGPAGKLLDSIIKAALGDRKVRYAFTNLIACIPKDENDEKVKEPDKEHIKACSDRLNELVFISNPQEIVSVGDLAKKHLPRILVQYNKYNHSHITHPAAILRMAPEQKPLAIQRCIVTIEDLF